MMLSSKLDIFDDSTMVLLLNTNVTFIIEVHAVKMFSDLIEH